MHAPARGPYALCQSTLERRLPILVRELDAPESAAMLFRQRRQTVAYRLEVAFGQQLLLVQHLRMRNGRPGVVADQALIEGKVLAGGVLQHAIIQRRPFVPQTSHDGSRRVSSASPAARRA